MYKLSIILETVKLIHAIKSQQNKNLKPKMWNLHISFFSFENHAISSQTQNIKWSKKILYKFICQKTTNDIANI